MLRQDFCAERSSALKVDISSSDLKVHLKCSQPSPMKEDRGMAKRKDDSDDESPHRKRQKITKDLASKAEIQTVQTSKDLSLLLSFEQDAGPRTRQSIA